MDHVSSILGWHDLAVPFSLNMQEVPDSNLSLVRDNFEDHYVQKGFAVNNEQSVQL